MHRSGELRGGEEFTAALDPFSTGSRRRCRPADRGRLGPAATISSTSKHEHVNLVGLGMSLHDAQLVAASETATGRWAAGGLRPHHRRIDVSGDEVTVTFEPGPPTPDRHLPCRLPGWLPTDADSDEGGGDTDRSERSTRRDGLPAAPSTERRSIPTDEHAGERPEQAAATTRRAAEGRTTPAAMTPDPPGPAERHLPEVRRSLEATFEPTGSHPEEYVQAQSWFEFYETWRGDDPTRAGEVPEAVAYFDRSNRKVYLASDDVSVHGRPRDAACADHDNFRTMVPPTGSTKASPISTPSSRWATGRRAAPMTRTLRLPGCCRTPSAKTHFGAPTSTGTSAHSRPPWTHVPVSRTRSNVLEFCYLATGPPAQTRTSSRQPGHCWQADRPNPPGPIGRPSDAATGWPVRNDASTPCVRRPRVSMA